MRAALAGAGAAAACLCALVLLAFPGHPERAGLLQAGKAGEMHRAMQTALKAREKAEALAARYAIESVDAELDRRDRAAARGARSSGQKLQRAFRPRSVAQEHDRLVSMQMAYRKEKNEAISAQKEQKRLKTDIQELLTAPAGVEVPLQQLGFQQVNRKALSAAERAEERKRARRLRRSKQLKYRYKWGRRAAGYHASVTGRRFEGRWQAPLHSRRRSFSARRFHANPIKGALTNDRRYWKADWDPTKHSLPNARYNPRKGGRWPLRPRDSSDAWLKYSATPQRFPHKDLVDLGDNYISGLAGRRGRRAGFGSPFEDKFTPYTNNNATRTPALLRPFVGRSSKLAPRDLRGPAWRTGGAYNPRQLPRAMRQIARGSLMGPRANSRSWRDARSPRRYTRGARGPRSRGARGPRSLSGRGPRSISRPAGATTLGNPFDSRFVPTKAFVR